mgnify:CR=1 FL=1
MVSLDDFVGDIHTWINRQQQAFVLRNDHTQSTLGCGFLDDWLQVGTELGNLNLLQLSQLGTGLVLGLSQNVAGVLSNLHEFTL